MARRAAAVCLEPGCVHAPVRAGRCEIHAGPAWAGSHDRRAELGVPATHERRRLGELVRRRARGRCENCGALPQPGERFVVDHRVPVGEGGAPAELENLWLLCPACDERKTEADLARMRGAGSPSIEGRARRRPARTIRGR